MPDRDWWSVLWPEPESVMQELDVPCGEVAVDLCCGDRYFTAALCGLGAPGKVYAIELDPEILNQAKQCITG